LSKEGLVSRSKTTIIAATLVTLVLFVTLFAPTAVSAQALPALSGPLDLPPGLSADDWAAISGQIEAQQSPGLSAADPAPFSASLLGALPARQAYLKASNTKADDRFGYSVAIYGDTVVVGALGEGSSYNSAPESGAAYIFIRSGSTWTEQAYLKASNTGAGDCFGWSVAISGDTVVVGAPCEASNATGVNGNQSDNSAAMSGAAYVFTRSGSTWTQEAYLKASNTDANDYFGLSVALSADTAVVGALGEDSNATGVNGNQGDNSAISSGAAYVFVRSGSTWTQEAYLKASNTGGYLGHCVAISGDTVVVGAVGEASSATGVNGDQSDNSAPHSGAAYVFARSGSIWTQEAYLKASNTGAGDQFGYSVAVSGETVVVGAKYEYSSATGVNGNQSDNGTPYSGAAYVFTRSGSSWTQQAYLKASNTGEGDSFGYSVAVSGETVVVGAPGEASSATGVNGNQSDNSAAMSGAAYVFSQVTTLATCTYLRGSDRYDTAIKISQAMFPGALPAGSGLVLAPGQTFPEALCGAPLAAAYGGPVLLTPSTGLNNAVRAEILRLAPERVFCIGLPNAVVTAVRNALGAGGTAIAIRGSSVYDMSYKVAKALAEKVGDISGATAIITRGDKFPDAIGVSPLACAKKWPILLTSGSSALSMGATLAMRDLGITKALKVGTYATLPAWVTGVGNLSGADRYRTNANVAVWAKANAGLTFTHIGLATGDKFPDALAAGPYLAKDGGILLLSPLGGPLPAAIGTLITANAPAVQHVTFIACIEPVIGQVKALLP
jgi:hypothetical protein